MFVDAGFFFFFEKKKDEENLSHDQSKLETSVPGLSDNLSGRRCWAVVSPERASSKDNAKARAPLHAQIVPHLSSHANLALVRRGGWRFVACLHFCSLAQETLSFERPPTSRRASQNHESGSPVATRQLGVHSFLASSGAHQSSPIDVDAAISFSNVATIVVSTASWAPGNKGSPSATTSRRRPSTRS